MHNHDRSHEFHFGGLIWGGADKRVTEGHERVWWIFFWIFAFKYCILVLKELTLYTIIGFRRRGGYSEKTGLKPKEFL